MSTEHEPPAPAPTAVKRREFLKVLGVGTAATTMLGCASEKVEKLIPYLVSPDQTVPGVSTYYATTCRECSVACGLIAETRQLTDGIANRVRVQYFKWRKHNGCESLCVT